jgi:hypothetical protein
MNDDNNAPVTFVPALPDWYVAIFWPAGSEGDATWGPSFDLEPIIAWAIEPARRSAERRLYTRMHYAEPIIAEGSMRIGPDIWAFKRPNGTFAFPDDRSFDTEDAALKYAQAMHDEDEREREAEGASSKLVIVSD